MRKNDNLKHARIRLGLSQVELADKLGLKQSYISKLERGDSFSYDQAIRIGEVLGVKPSDIMQDEGNITTINRTEAGPMVESSLREIIRSKDQTIEALREQIEYLKERLSQYESKPKTGTN